MPFVPTQKRLEGFLYADPLSIIVGEIAAAARRCCSSCEKKKMRLWTLKIYAEFARE